MATLLDMRTRIKNALAIQGTEFDTDIDDSIRSALLQYQQEPMWFLEATTTITLASGSDSVALPSDFAQPRWAYVQINGIYRGEKDGSFKRYTFEELEEFCRQQLVSGSPRAYAYYAGLLYVDVSANADYIIKLNYFKKDETLPQDDTDTSVWFNDGYDAIRTLAMAMFKDEVEEYQSAGNDWARADRYLRDLRKRNTQYQLGGFS